MPAKPKSTLSTIHQDKLFQHLFSFYSHHSFYIILLNRNIHTYIHILAYLSLSLTFLVSRIFLLHVSQSKTTSVYTSICAICPEQCSLYDIPKPLFFSLSLILTICLLLSCKRWMFNNCLAMFSFFFLLLYKILVQFTQNKRLFFLVRARWTFFFSFFFKS